MSIYYSSNRRKTARRTLNISGKLTVKNISETVEIENITYEGLGVVFSNNKFLLDFLEAGGESSSDAEVVFNYDDIEYSFAVKIYWIRLYQLGEHDFYTASGLLFKNPALLEEEKILEIMLDLDFARVYLG
jgi:hypothetical protein